MSHRACHRQFAVALVVCCLSVVAGGCEEPDPTEAPPASTLPPPPTAQPAAPFAPLPEIKLSPSARLAHHAPPIALDPGEPSVGELPRPRAAAVDGPPPGAVVPPPPWAPSGETALAAAERAWASGAWEGVTRLNPRAPGPPITPAVAEPDGETDGEARRLKHIMGADDRVRVGDTRAWPHRAVVKIYMRWGDDWYGCSGAVVQPEWVLTAGHCLFSHDRDGWADDLIVIPGKDGDFEPYGRWDWERAVSLGGWVGEQNYGFDAGLLLVRGLIGDQVGHFGIRRANDASTRAAWLHTAGYPGFDSTHMYGQACTVDQVTPNQILHLCDTEGGQSGSPMWIEDDGRFILGVHSSASRFDPPTNYAARFGEELFAWALETIGRCEQVCAIGATQCRGDGVRQICRADADGCANWHDEPCGAGAQCVDGGCSCRDDRFEPNDDERGGRWLEPGIYDGLAVCGGDDDWYAIGVERGERLSIQLHFSHAAGDLDMALYDEAGAALAGSAGVGDIEQIEVLAERGETTLLRVYGFAGAAGGYALVVGRDRVVPGGWGCALDSYGAGDGCDCACGAADPDCGFEAVGARGCGAGDVCIDGACLCVPECAGRMCGDDGCGGTCGACRADERCSAGGECLCVPQCDGRSCGDDGCGGTCGACADGDVCTAAGECLCVPQCDGRSCGDDGCGGTCGACADGDVCTAAGECLCVPQCEGRACGADDGCGGVCEVGCVDAPAPDAGSAPGADTGLADPADASPDADQGAVDPGGADQGAAEPGEADLGVIDPGQDPDAGPAQPAEPGAREPEPVGCAVQGARGGSPAAPAALVLGTLLVVARRRRR